MSNDQLVLNLNSCMKSPIELLETKLELKRYSPNTIETYVSMFKAFVHYFRDKKQDNWDEDDAREYLEYLVKTRKISRSYQNQCINAIKFYLEHVCGRPRNTYYFDRPQKKNPSSKNNAARRDKATICRST